MSADKDGGVPHGYPFDDWTVRDPDLKSLHDDPEFRRLFSS
jgi:hypothetical protein